MRVAMLCHYPVHLLPGFEKCGYRGPYSTWLPQLVKGFAEREGLEVHWITMTKLVGEYTQQTVAGQTFHLLPRGKQSLQILTGYRGEVKQICRLLEGLQPDIVHGWGSEQGYAKAAAQSGFPSMVSLQGILTEVCRVSKMPWLARVQARSEVAVLKQADHLTCESNWGLRVLENLVGERPMTRVEYGVHDDFYQLTWTPVESRPKVLFVGELTARKGVLDLLRAFQDERLSKVELVLAGDGDLDDEVKKAASSNIRCLGRISREEVANELCSAWALALPTWVDTSPNVVKEARVVGLPVITTRHGGQMDYVEDRVNGVIVEKADIEGLVQAVLSLTSSLQDCRAKGAARREETREELRAGRTVDAFSELYSCLMGERNVGVSE